MKFWYLPVLLLIFAIHPNESQAVLLKMECVPSNVNFCTYVKTEFEKKTAHKLDIVVFPDPTDERLKIFQNIFNAHDSKSIDVFQADLIWMGLFQKHFLDLTEATASLKDKFFPSSWNHNIFNGKTKGIPAFLDAGMLYYRKDLLGKLRISPAI